MRRRVKPKHRRRPSAWNLNHGGSRCCRLTRAGALGPTSPRGSARGWRSSRRPCRPPERPASGPCTGSWLGTATGGPRRSPSTRRSLGLGRRSPHQGRPPRTPSCGAQPAPRTRPARGTFRRAARPPGRAPPARRSPRRGESSAPARVKRQQRLPPVVQVPGRNPEGRRRCFGFTHSRIIGLGCDSSLSLSRRVDRSRPVGRGVRRLRPGPALGAASVTADPVTYSCHNAAG